MVNKSGKITIAVLALGHGVTDLYANFLPALLPVFESKFNLTKSMVGVLLFALSISGSLCQVIYAYLGDKWSRRFFLILGPGVAAIFMCSIGLSPNFSVLFVLLLMGGMGVSAFHPHAASFVGARAGEKRGFGLSIFMTVGTLGYGFGPLIAAALISSALIGANRMPLFSILGILTSLMLYKYATLEKEDNEAGKSLKILVVIKPHIKPLTILCTIVILKATVSMVFTSFMSFLMAQREKSLVIGGGAISLLVFSVAVGTLLGGYLYDKVNRRKLLIFSLLLSSPFLLALVYSHGALFIIFLILAGITIGCSNPIPLAIAQELIPEGASTASSIMMGLSWGIAGLPLWLFGKLADYYGGDVVPSMSIATLLPLLAIILVFMLPKSYGRTMINKA